MPYKWQYTHVHIHTKWLLWQMLSYHFSSPEPVSMICLWCRTWNYIFPLPVNCLLVLPIENRKGIHILFLSISLVPLFFSLPAVADSNRNSCNLHFFICPIVLINLSHLLDTLIPPLLRALDISYVCTLFWILKMPEHLT